MSNTIDIKKVPAMQHLDACIRRYQNDLDRALQRFCSDALFGLAAEEQFDRCDYEAMREAVRRIVAQRKLSDFMTLNLMRRRIASSYANQRLLPSRHDVPRGPVKRYPRWAAH